MLNNIKFFPKVTHAFSADLLEYFSTTTKVKNSFPKFFQHSLTLNVLFFFFMECLLYYYKTYMTLPLTKDAAFFMDSLCYQFLCFFFVSLFINIVVLIYFLSPGQLEIRLEFKNKLFNTLVNLEKRCGTQQYPPDVDHIKKKFIHYFCYLLAFLNVLLVLAVSFYVLTNFVTEVKLANNTSFTNFKMAHFFRLCLFYLTVQIILYLGGLLKATDVLSPPSTVPLDFYKYYMGYNKFLSYLVVTEITFTLVYLCYIIFIDFNRDLKLFDIDCNLSIVYMFHVVAIILFNLIIVVGFPLCLSNLKDTLGTLLEVIYFFIFDRLLFSLYLGVRWLLSIVLKYLVNSKIFTMITLGTLVIGALVFMYDSLVLWAILFYIIWFKTSFLALSFIIFMAVLSFCIIPLLFLYLLILLVKNINTMD